MDSRVWIAKATDPFWFFIIFFIVNFSILLFSRKNTENFNSNVSTTPKNYFCTMASHQSFRLYWKSLKIWSKISLFLTSCITSIFVPDKLNHTSLYNLTTGLQSTTHFCSIGWATYFSWRTSVSGICTCTSVPVHTKMLFMLNLFLHIYFCKLAFFNGILWWFYLFMMAILRWEESECLSVYFLSCRSNCCCILK